MVENSDIHFLNLPFLSSGVGRLSQQSRVRVGLQSGQAACTSRCHIRKINNQSPSHSPADNVYQKSPTILTWRFIMILIYVKTLTLNYLSTRMNNDWTRVKPPIPHHPSPNFWGSPTHFFEQARGTNHVVLGGYLVLVGIMTISADLDSSLLTSPFNRGPGENPCRHSENMQTHQSPQSRIKPLTDRSTTVTHEKWINKHKEFLICFNAMQQPLPDSLSIFIQTWALDKE